MSVFPLLSLDGDLLIQVINKMHPKSYFRLQRTCSDIGKFLEKRPASVNLTRLYTLQYSEETQSLQFIFYNREINDVKALYGTRLEYFRPIAKATTEHFEEVCEMLKKNRIKANWAMIPERLSQKQCATLLQILDPIEVKMNSVAAGAFEALFHTKRVRKVEAVVGMASLHTAMTKMISKYTEVILHINNQCEQSQTMLLLHTALTILRDNRNAKLRKFQLLANANGFEKPIDVNGICRQFSLKVTHQNDEGILATMDMPHPFPLGSISDVTFGSVIEVLYPSRLPTDLISLIRHVN